MALSSGLVWSVGGLLTRYTDDIDAWQYLLWRSLGVIVSVELINRRHSGWVTARAYRSGRWMLAGCCSLWLASFSYVYALKNTTAANAAFLSSITPIVAAVLGWIVLRERLSGVTVGALAVAIGGLIVMVAADISAGNMMGNVAAVASSFGFAAYTICVRSNPARDWSPVLPGYGAMMIAICGSVTLAQGNPLAPNVVDPLIAVIHGGIMIVGGTLLYNAASRDVAAVPMTIFMQTETIFFPLWVFLFLGERPLPMALLGGTIIMAAVVGKVILDARTQRRRGAVR